MPALQIRDLPKEMYERLAALAEQDCRSLSQEALVFLREGIERRCGARRSRRDALAAIGGIRLSKGTISDSTALIREDRKR